MKAAITSVRPRSGCIISYSRTSTAMLASANMLVLALLFSPGSANLHIGSSVLIENAPSSSSVSSPSFDPSPSAATPAATYQGSPFKQHTLPGRIFLRDYDLGGPGVAFCRSPSSTSASACSAGIKLDDWCCTSVRCDERSSPACPPYRTDADNAGLSHMNAGEPDQDPAGNLIEPEGAYISYTKPGQWLRFTVNVSQPGRYSVAGVAGSPRPDQNATPTNTLTFISSATAAPSGTGGGSAANNSGAKPNANPNTNTGDASISTGMFAIPPSRCYAGARCTEGFHVWQWNEAMAEVNFPVAGQFVMTWTLIKSAVNPYFFDFTHITPPQ